MAERDSQVEALTELLDAGWISEVLYEVKSGKEATVYCCAAPADAGHALLAAKVYRDVATRRFRNAAVYQAGRVHLAREGRAQRAAVNRSAFGLKVEQAIWIDTEWETMHRLSSAGLDVPKPLRRTDRVILMPFLGDETGCAPMLHAIELDQATAGAVVDRLLWNIERMLDLHVVHGDLSPFNIIWHDGRAIIIDLPQAIDPRLNPAAESLLARDIANVCDWARGFGADRKATSITADLWHRFLLGEIG
jgi:RIO kinase 1